MSIKEQLQGLGLSEKETKVYMASLELGSYAVQEIARKAGVNRATTYVQIESLIKKGLMSSVIRGKKRYFNAENPGYLLKLLDKQKFEINDKRREFEKYIPELEAMFNNAQEKPKVKYYEGVEGIKAIQNDIMREDKGKIRREIADLDRSYELFPPHPKDHRSKIKEKLRHLPLQAIYTSKQGAILPKKEFNQEMLFVPYDKFNFPADICLYGGNKVAFINCFKANGVIIENKEIFDSINSLFELAWERL